MANLTDAQFRELMGAINVSKTKVEKFASADGVEWMTWRSNFEITCDINGWAIAGVAADAILRNQTRRKREIAAAMQGAAKRAVADIEWRPDAVTSAQLLTLYEERFLPAAQGDLAYVSFGSAAQRETETALEWHSRLRDLFGRAYPLRRADAEHDRDLIQRFVLGMKDQKVREAIYDRRPATYSAALVEAHNKVAALAILSGKAATTVDRDIKIEPGLHAMGDRNGCWFCNDSAHQRRECKLWAKAKKQLLEGNDKKGKDKSRKDKKERGNQRGGRGGGRRDGDKRDKGKGKKSSSSGRSDRRVHALGEDSDSDRASDTDEEDQGN